MDQVIQLDESSVPVIQDTLAILTSKEIKLSSLRRYSKNNCGQLLISPPRGAFYVCMYICKVLVAI